MGTASDLPPCNGESMWSGHNCVGSTIWDNGNKYVGEFKDAQKHGQGTFTWINGDKYVGGFRNNNAHGQGTYTWTNGDKYVGEHKDDLANGQGTYSYANGNKYVGEWKDDSKTGKGTYTWADGGKYVGEFKDNKKYGKGTYTYPNGDKYIGEFSDDKFNGEGIKTYVNGKVEEGIWKDWEFQYAKKLSPTVPVTKTCSKDVKVCTKDQLCTKASMSSGGDLKIWRTYQGSQQYVTEAKRRRLACGVTEIVALTKPICYNDVEMCNNFDLCVNATYYSQGQKVWRGNNVIHVAEAKRRDLTCGVTEVAAQSEKKQCDQYPEICDEKRLCQLAVGQQSWETRTKYLKYVTEAKRRGLRCGVKEVIVQPKKSCSDNIRDCNKNLICMIASNGAEGQRYWTKNVVFLKYVTEAKRRGLTCGVTRASVKPNRDKVCSEDVNVCSNKKLCRSATFISGGNYVWNKTYKQTYVTEAKRRGLRCGVKEVIVQPKKSCSDNIRDCNKNLICMIASNGAEGQRYWTKNVVFLKYVTEAKRRGLTCGVTEVAVKPNTGEIDDLRKQLDQANSALAKSKKKVANLQDKYAEKQEELSALKDKNESLRIELSGQNDLLEIERAIAEDTIESLRSQLLAMQNQNSQVEVVATEPASNQSISSVIVQITSPAFDVYNCAFNLEFTNSETGKSFDVVMYAEGGEGNFTAATKDIEKALSESGLSAGENDWSKLTVKAEKFDDPNVVCQPENQNSYPISKDGADGSFIIDSDGQLTMTGMQIVPASESDPAEVVAKEPVFSESITSIVAQVKNPDFDMKNCSFNLEFTNTASGKSFDVAMDSTDGANGKFTATANDIEDGLADAGLNYEDNQWNRLKVKITKSDYPFVSCQPEGQAPYKIAKDRSVNTFKINSDGQLQIMDLPIVTVNNSVDVEVAEEEAVSDDWRSKYWQIQANQLFGKDRLEVRKQHYTETLGISKIEIFKLYQDGNQYVLAFGPFETVNEAYKFFENTKQEKGNLFPDKFQNDYIRYGDGLLDWFKFAEDGSVIFERIDTNNNNTLETVQDGSEADQNDQDIADLNLEERKKVQRLLIELDFYFGKIDGAFGGGTKRAIKTYQALLNENETGFLTVGQFNNLLKYAKP